VSDDERALGAILHLLAELLGKNLPPSGNFFELGGSSLDAVDLVAMLRGEYQLDVSLEDVFSAASLEQLAARCIAFGEHSS